MYLINHINDETLTTERMISLATNSSPAEVSTQG